MQSLVDTIRRTRGARRRDNPSSIVKRSRVQSTDAPSRRIWFVIVEPDSSFHSQTRSTNFARPRSWRDLPSAASWFSTIFCVAMPAWSVPPCHRCRRAAHAVIADQRVHDRLLERVAHVQRAGDVRRRQQDAVRLAVARGREIAVRFPVGVPPGFHGAGFESLVHVEAGIWESGFGIRKTGRDGVGCCTNLQSRIPSLLTCRASPLRTRAACTRSSEDASLRARRHRRRRLRARARTSLRAFVAKIHDQRAIGGRDAGCGDDDRRHRVVLVAGELMRDECIVVERPQLFVERVGLLGRARENQRRLLGGVGLLDELADQQQRIVAKARLVDEIEIGARHRVSRAWASCRKNTSSRPRRSPRSARTRARLRRSLRSPAADARRGASCRGSTARTRSRPSRCRC